MHTIIICHHSLMMIINVTNNKIFKYICVKLNKEFFLNNHFLNNSKSFPNAN